MDCRHHRLVLQMYKEKRTRLSTKYHKNQLNIHNIKHATWIFFFIFRNIQKHFAKAHILQKKILPHFLFRLNLNLALNRVLYKQ